MKRMLLPLVLAGAFFVGADAGEKKDSGVKEPPTGFTSLFNGKDLSSWKNADKQPEWTVEDGLIHYSGMKGKNLATAKNYKDFELWVDWKITKAGDSGIYLRGQPQVQIWDSDTLGDNLKADIGLGSGGLWNNPKDSPGQKPLVKADNPVGPVPLGVKVNVKLSIPSFVKSDRQTAEIGLDSPVSLVLRQARRELASLMQSANANVVGPFRIAA